jgi:hypothetical protein
MWFNVHLDEDSITIKQEIIMDIEGKMKFNYAILLLIVNNSCLFFSKILAMKSR